ncbi:hypothetical protein ACFL2O_07085 [Thermodesulfobacteriota bacterium]
MEKTLFKNLPSMLFADEKGKIYEHPYFRMAGFGGDSPKRIEEEDLVPMPRRAAHIF